MLGNLTSGWNDRLRRINATPAKVPAGTASGSGLLLAARGCEREADGRGPVLLAASCCSVPPSQRPQLLAAASCELPNPSVLSPQSSVRFPITELRA